MTTRAKTRQLISRVNTTPVGLQNLLGNVNQGINPHELNQEIRPTVDLYPHWATRSLQHTFEYNSIGGSGATLATAVPEGELWQIIGMSFTHTGSGTGVDDYQMSIGISPSDGSGAGNYVRLANDFIQNINAGPPIGIASVGITFPDRFILSGGWVIRGQIEFSNSSTATDTWLNILYVKLTD